MTKNEKIGFLIFRKTSFLSTLKAKLCQKLHYDIYREVLDQLQKQSFEYPFEKPMKNGNFQLQILEKKIITQSLFMLQQK